MSMNSIFMSCTAIWQKVRCSSDVGLVIDWKFHRQNRWVSIFMPQLVRSFVDKFSPHIISSQLEYDLLKKKLKLIISMEPGWAAPRIKYDGKMEHVICVVVSDPHNKTEWFADYVWKNGFDYVLSLYRSPFFHHFPNFPQEKFIHFPWAVPDAFISESPLNVRLTDVAIFGGKNSDAYDVRNWCRQQKGVQDFYFSGVENKILSNASYFDWLGKLDAAIAAGSSLPKYDLVTPKYFEIPAAGALLFGQSCQDLCELGFNDENAIVFQQGDFLDQLHKYKKAPESFLPMRYRCRELIRSRHKVSDRIKQLEKLMRYLGVNLREFQQC